MKLHTEYVNPASFKVNSAFTQGLAVKLGSADGTVDLATADTHYVFGITRTSGASGEIAVIENGGYCKVVLGTGGASKGAFLTAGTGGKLVATTTGGDLVCAIALETGVADELIVAKYIQPQLYSSIVSA